MEEETPAAVSSVTKEKSSKVSDLINRFEGGRYVMEFELVCDSVYCVGIVGAVRKHVGTVVGLTPIPAKRLDAKLNVF